MSMIRPDLRDIPRFFSTRDLRIFVEGSDLDRRISYLQVRLYLINNYPYTFGEGIPPPPPLDMALPQGLN